jgi:hypothetical protein
LPLKTTLSLKFLSRGPGEVQRYVLDFVEAATNAGSWVVVRRAIVLARGAGLSAREGAQRYVRNWRDVLDVLDISDDPEPSHWRVISELTLVEGRLDLDISDDPRPSHKESTRRAIRTLLRKGHLEAQGWVRAGPVSIRGMKGAHEAAVARARPSLERYVMNYGRPLPPYLQERYKQDLEDAFGASAAVVRSVAARRR